MKLSYTDVYIGRDKAAPTTKYGRNYKLGVNFSTRYSAKDPAKIGFINRYKILKGLTEIVEKS